MKKRWILDGIGCPNCALKVERELRKLPNVDELNYHFPSKRLSVRFQGDEALLLSQMNEVLKRTEPGATILALDRQRPSKEKRQEGLRLLLATLLFLLAFYLRYQYGVGSLFPHLNPEHGTFNWSFASGLSLFSFFLAYVLSAKDVYRKALGKVKVKSFLDENFLMILASLGAIVLGEYPEAVAVMLFYGWGEHLQGLAVDRSRRSIEAAMNLRPETAQRLRGDKVETVHPEELKVGDIVLLPAGARVPVDGRIIEGRSAIDTKAITGESVPVDVEAGVRLLSGCVNLTGLLKLEVEKVYDDSTVARMLQLIEDASEKKAPTERLITRFARYYTPVIVLFACLIACVPPLVLNQSFTLWLYRALIFLVASCPCALVISIPLAYFAGLGAASRAGILIKGGNTLEELSTTNTLILDKTGTLTEGRFVIKDIQPVAGFTKEDLLKAAAIAEASSRHPIAEAIKEGAPAIDVGGLEAEELAGFGVEAKFLGHTYLVGSARLMREKGFTPLAETAAATSAHLAMDGQYLGAIFLEDKIKDDSKCAISDLKDCKHCEIRSVIMFTGDNDDVASEVSRTLGIDRFKAELLPEDKLSEYELLEKADGTRVFIGDGINDAPVLMASDVGIAMGGIGQDAAIEAADIIIGNDNLHKVHNVLHIAKKTNRIVYQNIFFALTVKFLVLILGALGYATMWAAVFADVGVALLAVFNSFRILHRPPKEDHPEIVQRCTRN